MATSTAKPSQSSAKEQDSRSDWDVLNDFFEHKDLSAPYPEILDSGVVVLPDGTRLFE